MMLSLCMLLTSYWADLGNLIGEPSMTVLRIFFCFMKDNKLLTLVPLTPKQVYEDQVRLKQECDFKKVEKEKERKEKDEAKKEREKKIETTRK